MLHAVHPRPRSDVTASRCLSRSLVLFQVEQQQIRQTPSVRSDQPALTEDGGDQSGPRRYAVLRRDLQNPCPLIRCHSLCLSPGVWYEVITFGAPADHHQSFRHGGLKRLLGKHTNHSSRLVGPISVLRDNPAPVDSSWTFFN